MASGVIAKARNRDFSPSIIQIYSLDGVGDSQIIITNKPNGAGIVAYVPMNTKKIHLTISGLSSGSHVQAGLAALGSSLPTIVTAGAGRSTYIEPTVDGDYTFDWNGSAGVFFVGVYSPSNVSSATIKDVWCEVN